MAYIYMADIYCDDCGRKIREELDQKGEAPENPNDSSTYDSDEYPKGPYPDGGGEADIPQHCAECQEYLHNPLTSDGVQYVLEKLIEALEGYLTNKEALNEWAEELKGYFLTPSEKYILDSYLKMQKL